MSLVGKIAQIIDETKFVINLGNKDGVRVGQKFIIYQEGDEIFDPVNKESLGKLELPKGTIVVEHVQERLSIAATEQIETESERKKTLSELMVEASVQTERDRKKLPVDRTDLHPQARVTPVKIGDWIRNIE